MLNYLEEKKETFFDYKKDNFSKSKKSDKGDNPCFWSKNAYLFDLDLVKIRLAIMLSDFAEKKESLLTMNNRIFQSKKKIAFCFSKRFNAFGQKFQIFLFSHLVKIRLEIMLSDFEEKKETCFDYKNRSFSSPKNPLF